MQRVSRTNNIREKNISDNVTVILIAARFYKGCYKQNRNVQNIDSDTEQDAANYVT